MNLREWERTNKASRLRLIGQVFRNACNASMPAAVPGQDVVMFDLPELSQIFGLWRCTLYAVKVEGGAQWKCKAGFGLKILGIKVSDEQFASADDALAGGLTALDVALRSVIDDSINPWDDKHRVACLAGELRRIHA